MGCRWRDPLLLLGAALGSAELAAAQKASEIGLQAVGTFSDPAVVAAGGYGALRISGRSRLSAALVVGVSDRELAWRGELLGHFLLSPEEPMKPGFYFAGGIAGVEGAVERGYMVLTLGVENRPGAGAGWAVEAGLGGGFRVAVAYRWRRFSRTDTQ